MSALSRIRSLWRAATERTRFETDMDEEFRSHMEMRTADLVRSGLSPEEAARRARLEFGNPESLKEEGRESRGLRVLEEVRADAAYAVRTLRRNPMFASIAVLTLALGIGANATIFSVTQRVLLRPIAAPQLDRLVVIQQDLPGFDLYDTDLSPIEVEELAARTDAFQSVAGYRVGDHTLTAGGEPVRIATAVTMGDFAGVFVMRPHLGRMYDARQSTDGTSDVVVLSYDLWQRIGGGDSSFVGRTIELSGRSVEVIGVMPPEFEFPRRVEAWLPFAFTDAWRTPQRRGSLIMSTVARLQPGVTEAGLAAHLDAQEDEWAAQFGWTDAEPGKVLHATPLIEHLAGPLRTVLLVLAGAVLFVLMIAAANLASLQLVRTIGRTREIAVRRALGASRGRVARQLLVESALLGVAGAVGGVLIGALILRVLASWEPARQMDLAGAGIDGGVLALTLAAALVTTFAFAVLPAVRAARIDPHAALRQTAATASPGVGRSRLLQLALVTQVALALVLLLGSALMVRTLQELLASDPGFESKGVTTAQVAIAGSSHDAEGLRLAFFDALLERLRSLPGIDHAALVWGLPFTDQNDSSPFDIPDRPRRPGEPDRHAEARIVSDDYFATMQIPLLRGGDFDGTEGPGTPIHAVIDQTFAEQFFPDENPVGRRIRSYFGDEATIVGVVRRVDHDEIGDAPKAVAYYSYRHQYWAGTRNVVVRSSLPSETVADMIRGAVAEIDPGVPVFDVQTMEARVAASLGPRRLATVTLLGFATLALLLAAFGVYGVMRYTTNLRRHEIGVRLAVGARPAGVVALVVRQGVVLALVGIAIGTTAALVLTRFMRAILYGVQPQDPLAFGAGVLALLVAAALASWLPARRAARIEPMETLRVD